MRLESVPQFQVGLDGRLLATPLNMLLRWSTPPSASWSLLDPRRAMPDNRPLLIMLTTSPLIQRYSFDPQMTI